jgi:hypothetical protein
MMGAALETDILGAQNATSEFGIKVDGILVQIEISGQDILNASVDATSKQAV